MIPRCISVAPRYCFPVAGDHHLSLVRVAIAAVVFAGAAYWGWTALEQHKVDLRIGKFCDRAVAAKVLEKTQRDECQTNPDMRIAVNNELIRRNALYVLKSVSSGAAKLDQQLQKIDTSSYPSLSADQNVVLANADGKSLPDRFRVELHTVFIDDPEGDTTSWQLSGTRVDNGKLEILDLDGIGPAFLKDAQEGCLPLWGVGPKAACRAIAYVELDKADGTLGSFDNYIVVGLKLIPPTVEMIDQAIAERKDAK